MIKCACGSVAEWIREGDDRIACDTCRREMMAEVAAGDYEEELERWWDIDDVQPEAVEVKR